MNIEIKNRFNNEIIIVGEYASIKDSLEKNRGADLCGADLRGADLCGANLRGADLCGADLREAKNIKLPIVTIKGMSLRDYFAAKAMQGLVSVHNSYGDWTGCGDMAMNKNMAGTAYAVADAMLKARE